MGNLLVLISSLITLLLWLPLKKFSALTSDPLLGVSQILALIGIVLSSWSLVLSTKIKLIENLFHGLDKSYNVHRIIGSLAFIFLINHPVLLILRVLPSLDLALQYLIPSSDLAYSLGIIGLYAMILAFLFIVFVKLPYHVWKITHKLMGVGFMFGSLHSMLIGSDISDSLPLRIWTTFFILLGSVSAFYIVVLYRKTGAKFNYFIESTERRLDIINLYLKPENKKIRYTPGQFVYLSVKNNHHISDELHPFSISSIPQENNLRLSIKINGDYTLKLPELKRGVSVEVFGPHGEFGRLKNNLTNEVWIAGGIGITPFLSLLSPANFSHKNIYFFYCTTNQDEAVFDQEIINKIKNHSNISYVKWLSEPLGRISIDKIKNRIPEFYNSNFLLCGPESMVSSLNVQLLKSEIKENQIYFENFSFARL